MPQRAVKKLAGKAFSSKLLAAARGGTPVPLETDPEDDIEMELMPDYIDQSVTRMSFDVFEVEKESQLGALVWVTESLLEKAGLVSKLKVKRRFLRSWLVGLKGAYNEENSYHNQLHGADVAPTTYCLMMNSPLGMELTDKMKYVCLLAAAAHDVGHVGLNNNFLVNTNDPLAVTYCYEAPLEKMHASKGFEVRKCNICSASLISLVAVAFSLLKPPS